MLMARDTSSSLSHPSIDEFDFFQIMKALADPVRLEIVMTLAGTPGLTCSDCYPGATPSTLTRHFKTLREAGVIWQEDLGNRQANTLRKADLDERFPGFMNRVIGEGAAALSLDRSSVPSDS